MTQGRPRYRVLFDLAEGGMGVVSVGLLQADRGFQRMVALKRIHREVADDEAARRALLREAHLASLIHDPGIVAVHELVEQDGELLVVMELVEGVSLRTLLTVLEERHRRLPVPIAARILAKCARALEAAHEATDASTGAPLRVVHRDISPQNVLVSFRGEVKITDFGIAKALEESGESTRPGTLRGKPAYVAPEQVMSRAIDARTDLWSLGVVGHELFTGTRLFRGRTDAETLDRLLHADIPRLDEVRADVPPAIADVVARALVREPDARWSSARAFADALESAMGATRARRDDVAELVADLLGDEQRSFAARVRRAFNEPRSIRGGPPSAGGRAPAGARPALRFVAFMSMGLAAALVLRLAILGVASVQGPVAPDVPARAIDRSPSAPTLPRVGQSEPAAAPAAPSAPATRSSVTPTRSPSGEREPAPALAPAATPAPATPAPTRAAEAPRPEPPPAPAPAAAPAQPPAIAPSPRSTTPRERRVAPPGRAGPPSAPPPAPARPTAPGSGGRPAWMEFPL
ncbi:MAG: serine/threonine protein kinase [Deltaproteobacteria bacterium]|nr:serine/threonine protein kinase [Deltaproteobacteria bacterium]